MAVHSLHPKVVTKTAKSPMGQHPPRLPRASLTGFFSARTTTTSAQLPNLPDGTFREGPGPRHKALARVGAWGSG